MQLKSDTQVLEVESQEKETYLGLLHREQERSDPRYDVANPKEENLLKLSRLRWLNQVNRDRGNQ